MSTISIGMESSYIQRTCWGVIFWMRKLWNIYILFLQTQKRLPLRKTFVFTLWFITNFVWLCNMNTQYRYMSLCKWEQPNTGKFNRISNRRIIFFFSVHCLHWRTADKVWSQKLTWACTCSWNELECTRSISS